MWIIRKVKKWKERRDYEAFLQEVSDLSGTYEKQNKNPKVNNK